MPPSPTLRLATPLSATQRATDRKVTRLGSIDSRGAARRSAATARDACTVCGATARRTIVQADTIASQLAWLEAFHRRRLKTAARARREAALEDRASFTQDDPRAIVGCRSCGLVFRHPRRTPDAVEREYADDRYGAERLRTLFAGQVRAYDAKLAALRQLVRTRHVPKVLEVGSFVGGFLTAAGSAGWEVLGVDPGEEVVAFCRERGLPVERGTIEDLAIAADLAIAPASLDAVAIWNTFDQIAAPGPTLASAARLLRSGGVLAIRVPNGRFFADAMARLDLDPDPVRRWRLLTLAWNNLIGFPYLHGYTPATLDRLVARYGFERVRAEPDTLLPLADRDTRWWAVLEERAVKAACRLAWRRQIPGPARLAAAPWLDVYYRRNGAAVRPRRSGAPAR
jgi:SAM-dependent methyltransferase